MRPRRENGAGGLLIAVVLLLAALGVLAGLSLVRGTKAVERSADDAMRLQKIHAALASFVGYQGWLPCPANPAANPETGDADPPNAAAACNSPTGTVPWRTLGMRRDDSYDASGWKISYRVYAGPTGLTQDGGASMVACDLVDPFSAGAGPDGRCRSQRDTTVAEFMAGKGLSVDDFGAVHADVAYLLVGHGPSGLGAFTASGSQKPLPANAAELANLSANGPFVARAAARLDDPSHVDHFDDTLSYRRIEQLAREANVAARDWPEAHDFASVRFDEATVSAAMNVPSVSPGDLGRATITFPNVRVSGFDSAGGRNIAFDNSTGTQGIGVVGGGNSISSATGEGFRFTFAVRARKLAFTLAGFAIQLPVFVERVELRFFDGADLISTHTKLACSAINSLASYTVDAGADFDRLEMRALATLPAARESEFVLAEIRSCPGSEANCVTSLASLTNTCL